MDVTSCRTRPKWSDQEILEASAKELAMDMPDAVVDFLAGLNPGDSYC